MFSEELSVVVVWRRTFLSSPFRLLLALLLLAMLSARLGPGAPGTGSLNEWFKWAFAACVRQNALAWSAYHYGRTWGKGVFDEPVVSSKKLQLLYGPCFGLVVGAKLLEPELRERLRAKLGSVTDDIERTVRREMSRYYVQRASASNSRFVWHRCVNY